MDGWRAGGPAVVANHKVFLANLARKKALEREAMARREATSDRPQKQRLEAGFQCFFNGANRDIGPGRARPSAVAKQPQRESGGCGSRRTAIGTSAQPRGATPLGSSVAAPTGELAHDCPGVFGTQSTRRRWETGKVFGVKVLEGEDKGVTIRYDYTGRPAAAPAICDLRAKCGPIVLG